ncbi:MAG: hypothetical protein JW969_04410 [Spirochaetales bacterium]|nr:hypothetical protein [Spirochaetales bacterium]
MREELIKLIQEQIDFLSEYSALLNSEQKAIEALDGEKMAHYIKEEKAFRHKFEEIERILKANREQMDPYKSDPVVLEMLAKRDESLQVNQSSVDRNKQALKEKMKVVSDALKQAGVNSPRFDKNPVHNIDPKFIDMEL